MAVKIFISHANADRAYAQQLAAALAVGPLGGIAAFSPDLLDSTVATSIRTHLRDTIRAASAVVVIVTPEGLASNWVNFETGVAAGLGVPVLSVLVRGGPATLPGIDDVSVLDARGRDVAGVAEDLRQRMTRTAR
jgi:hypothetical protein